MNKNSICWFEIYVSDMTRAKKFYESVFETKLENLSNPAANKMDLEMWSFCGDMNAYGANGALVHMPGFPVGKNSTIIYFSCENCSVEESRIKANGGKIEKQKFSIGQHGFISLVYDTEGNMIGLHSLK